jgi:hypothetical protein
LTLRTRTVHPDDGKPYTIAASVLDNRLLRLVAVAATGEPLCAPSWALLMSAPTPAVEQPVGVPDTLVRDLLEFGEAVRREEEAELLAELEAAQDIAEEFWKT